MSRAQKVLKTLGVTESTPDVFDKELVTALKKDWVNVKGNKDGSGEAKLPYFLAKWRVSGNDPAIWLELSNFKAVKCTLDAERIASELDKLSDAYSAFMDALGI